MYMLVSVSVDWLCFAVMISSRLRFRGKVYSRRCMTNWLPEQKVRLKGFSLPHNQSVGLC